MSITKAIFIVFVAVCAFFAIVGLALAIVQWSSELRAIELFDKQHHPDFLEKR